LGERQGAAGPGERGFKRGLGERFCIKYKIMAVQPLNKTKIIKKKTNKIRRYQSDEFKRVKVGIHHLSELSKESLASSVSALEWLSLAIRHAI